MTIFLPSCFSCENVGELTALNSVPSSVSVTLLRKALLSLPLSLWNERPTVDSFDLCVADCSALPEFRLCDEKPGTIFTTSGLSEGAHAHTRPRFISIAAQ
jgi:hypothetical protein